VTLDRVKQDVEQYISDKGDLSEFHNIIPASPQSTPRSVIWVVKYIPSAYLTDFLSLSQMRISSTAGFTWGDAVYAASLKYPYSSMMYGRAGIVGYIELTDEIRVFRADEPEGIKLYQRWIPYQQDLYKMLTTTLHADTANRELRNEFRQTFRIDIVVCSPDQEGTRAGIDQALFRCAADLIPNHR
jgi:hypothetical protein